jgi:haloacid dehalogenase-like hydrolase
MLFMITVLATIPASMSSSLDSYQSVSASNNTLTSTNVNLSSWNQGTVKESIVNFVNNVTNPQSSNFVPPEDRIAVFDNDGTMWSEEPIPFQGFFTADMLEEKSKSNPEIKQNLQVQQLLKENFTNLELSEQDVMYLASLVHSNITQPVFDEMVENWAETAEHPQTHIRFVEMVYQPMLELVNYLKDNDFKIFIVSGGGIDFMRESLSKVYGIPPDQFIGSSLKYQYINGTDGKNSTIFREPEPVSLNFYGSKPENIQLHVGQVPIFAAGNSDNDLQMLTYTDDNNKDGKSLQIIIHHDDGEREYSYNEGAEGLLEQAENRNWGVVSMKNDFIDIFPTGNGTNLSR